jgi:hypothetical protein
MIQSVTLTFHVQFFKTNQHNFFPFFCSIFCKKKFVANVHPFSFFFHIFIHKYHLSMNTLQNIHPHHQIFCPMCQIIFFKYYVDVNKIFENGFTHAHLFMLTCSHFHKITSLVYLWSMLGLLVIVIKNISSILVLIVVTSRSFP